MSKSEDAAMLAAYNAALERGAVLLKAMGCDDPKQATSEQIRAVAGALLAGLGKELSDEGVELIAKQIEADHRKLTRLKARQVS